MVYLQDLGQSQVWSLKHETPKNLGSPTVEALLCHWKGNLKNLFYNSVHPPLKVGVLLDQETNNYPCLEIRKIRKKKHHQKIENTCRQAPMRMVEEET